MIRHSVSPATHCVLPSVPRLQAGTFYRTADFLNAAAVTAHSGISALLPGAQIDDFVFDPCGYSMNALRASTFSTIHVTPEDSCSYASFELSGPDLAGMHASDVVAKVGPSTLPQPSACPLQPAYQGTAGVAVHHPLKHDVEPSHIPSCDGFPASAHAFHASLESDIGTRW